MGEEILYTISQDTNVIAKDVKAEYVPILVRGLLAEWWADAGLEIKITAQNPNDRLNLPRM